MDIKRDLTLLTDIYELTMANSYFVNNHQNKIAYFDMFFRKVPDNGGFAIMAGLAQLIDYLKNLKFSEEDINYLSNKGIFNDEFIEYLKNFQFTCDVWSVEEGTPIFPYEPLVIVRGPIIQAQFIETMLLLTINHQCLIATKTNRIVRAAKGRPVMEFGARRAQGYDGSLYGARAAYIGGASGTSCTLADKYFQIPASGTMAHSYVQMHEEEISAFREYAKTYPNDCVLLVDTYNVLQSGIPNAIKVFNEEIVTRGFRPKGIRIDSGDITYLSKKAREMLDEAGFEDCNIIASNSLDEYIIRDIFSQGAKVDAFGVGERLITSKSSPVFGGVYKLVAIEDKGELTPRIKISENVDKITNPGFKQVYRFYDKSTNKALVDVVTLHEEKIEKDRPYEIFDPEFTWKRKKVTNFYAKELLVQIFDKGKCIYESPSLENIAKKCKIEVNQLWEASLRFENPHQYYVDLSQKLWNLKNKMIYNYSLK